MKRRIKDRYNKKIQERISKKYFLGFYIDMEVLTVHEETILFLSHGTKWALLAQMEKCEQSHFKYHKNFTQETALYNQGQFNNLYLDDIS